VNRAERLRRRQDFGGAGREHVCGSEQRRVAPASSARNDNVSGSPGGNPTRWPMNHSTRVEVRRRETPGERREPEPLEDRHNEEQRREHIVTDANAASKGCVRVGRSPAGRVVGEALEGSIGVRRGRGSAEQPAGR
jgi:hypothetical protein